MLFNQFIFTKPFVCRALNAGAETRETRQRNSSQRPAHGWIFTIYSASMISSSNLFLTLMACRYLISCSSEKLFLIALLKAAAFHRQRRNDGAYLADKQEISYGPGYGKAKTVSFIAHEYTHHVQHVTGFYHRRGLNLAVALEGHARGVDQHLSRRFSEHLHMRGYLYHYLNTSVEELTGTYLWMCRQLNRSPRASIIDGLPQSRITTASFAARSRHSWISIA